MELYSKCVVLNSRGSSSRGGGSSSASKSNRNHSNINGNGNDNDNDKQMNTNDMEWRCGFKTEQIFWLMQVQQNMFRNPIHTLIIWSLVPT